MLLCLGGESWLMIEFVSTEVRAYIQAGLKSKWVTHLEDVGVFFSKKRVSTPEIQGLQCIDQPCDAFFALSGECCHPPNILQHLLALLTEAILFLLHLVNMVIDDAYESVKEGLAFLCLFVIRSSDVGVEGLENLVFDCQLGQKVVP